MDLILKYNQMYDEAIEKIKTQKYQIDEHLADPNDHRFGLTLLIRPSETLQNQIQLFIKELQKDNPEQYFYPNSDLHITVLSIISCEVNFKLDSIQLDSYISVINESLKNNRPFTIDFKGITASDSAIMIQGYPENNRLNSLREQLIENFQNTNLKLSINKRYKLETAHCTVYRFQFPIQQIDKLLDGMKKFRDFDFGQFSANHVELVYNDWYQKSEKTVQLHRFIL